LLLGQKKLIVYQYLSLYIFDRRWISYRILSSRWTAHSIRNDYSKFYNIYTILCTSLKLYSQACIKWSPFEQRKSSLIR